MKYIDPIFSYLIRVGDAVSQLLNVIFLFSENSNESISGRCWRQRADWKWDTLRKVIDFIFRPFEEAHCKKSYYADVLRALSLIQEEKIEV